MKLKKVACVVTQPHLYFAACPMGQHSENSHRARLVALLATTAVLLALVLPHPQRSQAATSAQAHASVVRDERQLRKLRTSLAQTDARLARTTALHARVLTTVRGRLVAIYKTSDPSIVDALMANGSTSVADTRLVAETVNRIARNDARSLNRVAALSRQMTQLRGEHARLVARTALLTRQLAQHRADLAAALRQAASERAAAQARAEAMAKVKDIPLTPRAVAPETLAASAGSDVDEPAPAPAGSYSGMASMYSDSFAGQQTASGERYNPGAMTAAHPSLPLGTWVTVHGPGGTALVRINDRGPFVGGRVLDLSRAAANAVGLGGLGYVSFSVQG